MMGPKALVLRVVCPSKPLLGELEATAGLELAVSVFELDFRTLADDLVLSSFIGAVALYEIGPGLPTGSSGPAGFASTVGAALVDDFVLSSFVEAVALYETGPALPAGSPELAGFPSIVGATLPLLVYTPGSMDMMLLLDVEMPGLLKTVKPVPKTSDGPAFPEAGDVSEPVFGLTIT